MFEGDVYRITIKCHICVFFFHIYHVKFRKKKMTKYMIPFWSRKKIYGNSNFSKNRPICSDVCDFQATQGFCGHTSHTYNILAIAILWTFPLSHLETLAESCSKSAYSNRIRDNFEERFSHIVLHKVHFR